LETCLTTTTEITILTQTEILMDLKDATTIKAVEIIIGEMTAALTAEIVMTAVTTVMNKTRIAVDPETTDMTGIEVADMGTETTDMAGTETEETTDMTRYRAIARAGPPRNRKTMIMINAGQKREITQARKKPGKNGLARQKRKINQSRKKPEKLT